MAKNKKTEEQNALNNPNDKFFKKLFGLVGVVQDYMTHLFPKHLSAKLDLHSLELDNTSYVTSELETYYSDIVWRCRLLGKSEYVNICFIFEHKSYVPDYPHIQIGDYKQGAYNKQLASGQPLSVVIPIIIYHGKRKWIKKPFTHYFGDIDEAFKPFIDPYEFYLTDLADYSDSMIEAFGNIFLVKGFLALKHYTEKMYIKNRFAELLLSGLEDNKAKENIDFIRALFVYLSHISGGISEEEITYQIEQVDNNQKKETMYNYIDDLLERGEKRGIEKGEQIGIEKGKKIAIYEAHLRGIDIDLLSNIFALTPDEIRQIIEEVKNDFAKK
jgi:predicted transposase/invertase (TIGR01784 family)